MIVLDDAKLKSTHLNNKGDGCCKNSKSFWISRVSAL